MASSKTTAAILLLAILTGFASCEKVVALDFTRHGRRATTAAGDSTLNVPVGSQNSVSGSIFFANISIGTPPQPMRVLLDTGSSDLFVPQLGSKFCALDSALCNSDLEGTPLFFGGFDSNKSSTFHVIHDLPFNGSYGTAQASGVFGKDVASMGDVELQNVTLGVATEGQLLASTPGILGLAPAIGEYAVEAGKSKAPYPTFLENLKSQGLIDALVFSVWSNDGSNNNGRILFGGVDQTKYDGRLATIPMIANPEHNGSQIFDRYVVPLTSLVISAPSGNKSVEVNIPAVLDTGTGNVQMPHSLGQSLSRLLGINETLTPCTAADEGITITFGFNNDPAAQVAMPLTKEIFMPIFQEGDLSNTPVVDQNGTPVCRAPFAEGDLGPFAILGFDFLRYAYTTFDLERRLVGIAQAKNGDDIASQSSIMTAAAGTSGPLVGGSLPTATASVTTPSLVPTSLLPAEPDVVLKPTNTAVTIPTLTPSLSLSPTGTPSYALSDANGVGVPPTGSTGGSAASVASASSSAIAVGIGAAGHPPSTTFTSLVAFVISAICGLFSFLL